MSIKKFLLFICVSIIGFGASSIGAHAATEFMTSWQTKTYVPAWYEGKAFPTYQTAIVASFDLIEDGQIVDLSKTAVRWYADENLLKNETNGLGIKRVTIFNKKYGGDVSSIRISIPDYKGRALEKQFNIPIKTPEVVIDVPHFQKRTPKGENKIYAWPFFFNTINANNLSLRWTVDQRSLETKRAGDPLLLFTVGNEIPTGVRSVIEASVINQRKAMENISEKVFVEIR